MKKSVYILVILILLGIIGFLSKPYIESYLNKNNQTTQETEAESEAKNDDVKERENVKNNQVAKKEHRFKGKKIEGVVPDGWTVKEYFDGNGSDILTAGVSYHGLTGIKVFNAQHKDIFKMEAVYGIGGVGACSKYFKFSDDNTQYYNQILSDAQTVGMTVSVVDLSNTTYSSFTFLNKKFRRIGTDLYWDTMPGNNTFEAGCGMQKDLLVFNQLSWIADNEVHHDYHIAIYNSPSNSDLQQLDNVLSSIQPL